MEKEKKKRMSLRTGFTKAYNAFNETLGASVESRETVVAFQILEEKMSVLDVTTERVIDMLFDTPDISDATIQQEYSDADEYKRKFLTAKLAMSDATAGRADVTQTSNVSAQSDSKKTYKLPKIELIKFGGDVRGWLHFWSLFKKIHEDPDIVKEDKFQYLIQAMIPNSHADVLVRSFPPTAENYDKVITSLKNRFGRDDLQIEVYVRDLLQLVLQNAISPAKSIVLSSLYDKLESHLRSLDSLGVTTDKCAAMLFPLVESSLPEELLRAWQRSSGHNSTSNEDDTTAQSKDRLSQLIKFLEGEVQNEVRISMAVKGFDLRTYNSADHVKPRREKVSVGRDMPSAASLLTMKNKNKLCIFCDSSDHESAICEYAKKISLTERQNVVKKKRGCFNCLNVGHGFRKCRVFIKCAECSRRHVTLMCPGIVKEAIESKTEAVKKECSLASFCSDTEVFMQTLRVRLYNNNEEVIVRAVIDTGSQKSYITRKAAARVCYRPIAEQLMIHTLFGGEKSDTLVHNKFIVYLSNLDGSYSCNFTALDQKIICEEVPSVQPGTWLNELNQLNVHITDVNRSEEAVSILIGADIAGKLFTGKRHVLKCGLVAMETYLGWTLMGAVPKIRERQDATAIATSMFVRNDKIADLWALDVLGIKDPIENKSRKEEEKRVKETFLSVVKVNDEGRYEVKLPWLENHPALSNNKVMATRRLESEVKKLEHDGLYQEYGLIFDEWLAKGIIQRVPEEDKNTWGHYLPHRHVVKENSTTRIRPVFDASARDRQFPSLNECVEKGPNLIELVSAILLRFREGNIGLISDIKQAFLQISIDPKDRDFLRFLWFDKCGNEIIFRHCRVVFGISCSPFILGAIIELHLNKVLESLEDDANPKLSSDNILKLLNSFYVDNCVTSMNTMEQVKEFISDARTVMESAGFDLRGWEYNGDNSHENQTTILGIIWNKQLDTLVLKVPDLNQFFEQQITKRTILSITHRIFDPLGFASPVIICPRILLQETWALKLSWDEEVSEEIKRKFKSWLFTLKALHKIQIPRCFLGELSDVNNITLHTFSDASKFAYAAVVYIRIERSSGTNVHFVQAKSRVAPITKKNSDVRQSIPRLELLAANIGARLTTSILSSLNLKGAKVYYWTDSSTVLAWIRRKCNWATFVWNRVKEIRELSSPNQWGHVPGYLNPADLPSRGCTVEQLLNSKWWEGPEWLRMSPESWPSSVLSYNEEEIGKEVKKSERKSTTLLTSAKTNSVRDESWYSGRFSKYSNVVRVLAWIYRFSFNSKNKAEQRKVGDLSFSEVKNAEMLLIKGIQSENFVDETDERIKHFLPFKDEDDIIRLNTKIVLRSDTYNFRCPIILPGSNEIVSLIIKERHENLKHAGVEMTMSALRERFWILGGRKVIKSVIQRCVNCRRYDSKPLDTLPAALPLNRVRDAAIFEIIGVDFTGPMYLKNGKKTWICLFTCAVYRAVHLELVSSLSTASFLMALRRHIARRGRPSIIYSDNGTNFVGLNNMFKRLDFKKLAKVLATEQIQWKFNPPTAAWWGGFWERLIGILKRLLRRTLKRSCLDYEELLTVLLDCEAVINSRPITFMSDNNQEIVPLTPSMFLQEVKEIGVVDLDRIEKCQLDRRYAYRQKIKDDLRSRFRSEYLGALLNRKCKAKNNQEICIGDIVFVENENLKRLDWPVARVNDVIAGRDNNVRIVRLTTANGELTRPIQRIYPLELKCNSQLASENKLVIENYKNNERKDLSLIKDVSYDENECEERQGVVTKSGRKIVKPDRLTYY